MKSLCTLAIAVMLLLSPAAAFSQDAGKDKPNLDSDDAKISYYFGMNLGNTLKELPLEFSKEAFLLAVDEVMAGKDPSVKEEDLQAAMLAFQQRIQEAQLKKQQETDAAREKEKPANLEQINAFKADPNLKKTESGLQYRVITAGEGASPMPTDTVQVNYKGMLEDGTVFDSSYERGAPASFQVSRVIPGWTEALQLMSPGAKYEVLIPADKAYGSNPPPNSPIPPNANLFFEIELLKVL